MISVQFTWTANDWLGMERHWLPFKAYQKRLSLQTPRMLLLQFSFHILGKKYSRADEFVHAILLVIFDPIAITPAVVHGILTKISFPFTLHKTSLNLQHWELLTVTVQVDWILIKLFSCLEQNWDSMATRNAWRQWKRLCKISLQIGLHLVYLALMIKFILF